MRKLLFKNKKITPDFIIFTVYCILIAVGIFNHTPWRDEAQQWFLVQKLSFPQLIKQLAYEGHPFVWYAILFPFAKLGFPYTIMYVINSIFSVLLAYIVSFKFKESRIIKIAFLFSIPILAVFPIIARSYMLAAVLIISMFYLYIEDKDRNILKIACLSFLLTNTHVFCIGVSFGFGLVYLIDFIKGFKTRTKNANIEFIISLFIMISGAILLYFQLINSIKLSHFIPDSFTGDTQFGSRSILQHVRYFCEGLIRPWMFYTYYTYNKYFSHPIFIKLFISLSMFNVVFGCKPKGTTIIAICGLIGLNVIHVFVHPGVFSNYLGLFLVIIFGWIFSVAHNTKQKNNEILFTVNIILSVILVTGGIIGYFNVLNHRGASAKAISKYITKNKLENQTFLVYPAYSGQAVKLNISHINIYYPTVGNDLSYMPWSKEYSKVSTMTFSEIFHIAKKEQFYNQKEIYVLSEHEMLCVKPTEECFSPLFETEIERLENLYIYKIDIGEM